MTKYNKHEYNPFCNPPGKSGSVWGMFHIRTIYGECFYTMIINNVSEEKLNVDTLSASSN